MLTYTAEALKALNVDAQHHEVCEIQCLCYVCGARALLATYWRTCQRAAVLQCRSAITPIS